MKSDQCHLGTVVLWLFHLQWLFQGEASHRMMQIEGEWVGGLRPKSRQRWSRIFNAVDVTLKRFDQKQWICRKTSICRKDSIIQLFPQKLRSPRFFAELLCHRVTRREMICDVPWPSWNTDVSCCLLDCAAPFVHVCPKLSFWNLYPAGFKKIQRKLPVDSLQPRSSHRSMCLQFSLQSIECFFLRQNLEQISLSTLPLGGM